MTTPAAPRIFVSYNSELEARVAEICHCIRRQSQAEYYFYPENCKAGPFPNQIEEHVASCDSFVLIVSSGTDGSEWQKRELQHRRNQRGIVKLVVVIADGAKLPGWASDCTKHVRVEPDIPSSHRGWAPQVAIGILDLLSIPSCQFDDLPLELHASYEKDTFHVYAAGAGKAPPALVLKGYPATWPKVVRNPPRRDLVPNPLEESKFGAHRRDDAAIRVDARMSILGGAMEHALTFPEAGPRAHIENVPRIKAAVLVSGGIAPGINAVIAGIVERHRSYEDEFKHKIHSGYAAEIIGYLEGFNAFLRGGTDRFKRLSFKETLDAVNQGGSRLPTARVDELLTQNPVDRERHLTSIVNGLRSDMVDILYLIGGEGTMRAAHAISTVYSAQYPKQPISIIGIPKTMDNDILWVWQSFGFMSAVEKARETIIQLHTEVNSNPRVGVVQLFGSASGYVVSHAALGSNVCDLALIPEMEFKMTDVCGYMKSVLQKRKERGEPPSGVVVMAETAIPTDFKDYLSEDYLELTSQEKAHLEAFGKERRVLGQTPDLLRSAGLKIVSRVLQRYIREVMGNGTAWRHGTPSPAPPAPPVGGTPDPYWKDYRVLVNEPRHVVRSMAPSVTDVALGMRLGTMAVDMAMAGYSDCMVSQWLTEYVVVPLKLVVLGRKLVPRTGIFWKTVVSKTGQMQVPGLV